MAGVKTFTVRRDDRGYQCGDVLQLQEYDPTGHYPHTGRYVTAVVTYLLPLDEVPDLAAALDAPEGAWVVLGIKVVAS
jgi:hypothetical protein